MSEVVLLKVPVGDGGDDVIEVQVSRADLDGLEESGVVLAADNGGRLGVAAFSLASAADHVVPALRTIVRRLSGGVHAPDEVTMQLGLQFGGETGFFFAKGSAEANIAMTLTWRNSRDEVARAHGEVP